LVVDDDKVLREVLTRVLTRQGCPVAAAAGVEEALRLAEQQTFSLALIDLRLDDGDGVDLAERLAARQPGLPLLLMTAFPLQLREHPEISTRFRRVLTKPLDLEELRQAVTDVVREGHAPAPPQPSHSPSDPAAAPPETDAPRSPAPASAPPTHVLARPRRFAWVGSTVMVLFALAVLAGFVAYLLGVPIPGLPASPGEETAAAPPPLGVELVDGSPPALKIPDDVKEALGIRKGGRDVDSVAAVPPRGRTRPLVLTGSTAADPARILRVRVRFTPAKVIYVAQRKENPDPAHPSSPPPGRDLRSGDEVKPAKQNKNGDVEEEGDLLAVFYSDVVGAQKNALFDAVSDLKLNEKILAKAENSRAAVEAFVWNAERAVEGDKNKISQALNTLRAWDVPEKDIQAVVKEAEQSSGTHTQIDKEKLADWGRVELHVPAFGSNDDERPVIVENNLTRGELIQDPTLPLFQIAKVDKLLVVAYASEDDLPELLKLMKKPPAERLWTIHTAGAPDEGLAGVISDVGYFVDPNQHSLMVKGYVRNPDRDIRGTQLATASINLPPPDDVVEIDVHAVVDEGRQTLVWVQTDAAKSIYTLKRVKVTHRFDNTVYVKSKLDPREAVLTPEEKEQCLLPSEELHENDRVLTSGVLELRKEQTTRESK
jgi:CheY-like chemotaxis protein